MKLTRCLTLASVSLTVFKVVAGDLSIVGNLNVISNLTASSLSATNATVGTLVVNGNAVINGTVQGDGAGITNVPGAGLVSGSVTAGALASGAVTSAKIQDGAIADVDIAADAGIGQSKVAGLTTALVSLNAHVAAVNNPHGVTAAQIGALTNEVDSIALATLAQYAASNKVDRWQDSADSNIWWETKGGTNITVYQKELVEEGLNVVFDSDFKDGADNSTLYPLTLPFPFNTNGWSGSVGEFLYGEMAAFIHSPNGGTWVGVPPSSGCTIVPYPTSAIPVGNATLVPRLGWTTNVLASYNLPSGDVWQAVSTIHQSSANTLVALTQYTATNKVTRWQDSADSNIWWEANGGTNLSIWTLGSETGVRVTFSADFEDYEHATLYPLELPWPFATNGWWGGIDDYMGIPVAVIFSPNGDYWMSGAGATVISPNSATGEAYLTVKTIPTTNNLVASYNLPTGDVWQALSSLYPSSNPSNYVSASAVDGIVATATANLLTTTGNGSQLTGITAAQVGAYTTNQTDAAIAGALSGFNPGSCVQTNHLGDVSIQGEFSASTLAGNGAALTNLNLAAYVGSNLVWDAESNKLHAAASGPGYTDAAAVAAVTATHLNMHSNRVTNLAAPAADSDATTKAFIRQVLASLPPQGNLSMGVYTNGAPTTFPLSFDE